MEDNQTCVSKYPRWDRIKNRSIANWIHEWLGGKWGGNTDVPLSNDSITVESRDKVEYVFMFLNDSSEIGIGYPDEWHTMLDRKTFNKMIRWYLWKWSFGEWFGLRRWIWYKALFSICKKYKPK